MKPFITACIIAVLSTFATAVYAEAKPDFFTEIDRCNTLGGPRSLARQQCTQAAIAALKAGSVSLTQTPAAKSTTTTTTVTRDAETGKFTTKDAAKASPATTVTETVKK